MVMESGTYAAYTGLLARTQALDTAANNLANAGTTGFRAQRDYFRGLLADSTDSYNASQVGEAVNGFGVLGGNHISLSQGQLQTTGNPLDIALDGSGFFAVQTSNGIRYTRDGSFRRSSTGVLETSGGNAVLDAQQRPITIPTGTARIAPDGTISVTTPDGSGVVGKLGMFDFADPSALTPEGISQYAAPSSAVPTATTATAVQGSLEGANEDAVHGTMQLILVQRQAEMMQKALSIFNTDFDKVAGEDLGRVQA